jgi:hypothetical protein
VKGLEKERAQGWCGFEDAAARAIIRRLRGFYLSKEKGARTASFEA